jgi:hypothetical protein
MAKQPMRRKRGNPNWGKGREIPVPSAAAGEFEIELRRLGLTKQTCVGSSELRQWCQRNKGRFYIPEWLLEAWGITVEPNLGS